MNTLTTLTTFREININALNYISLFKKNQTLGVSGGTNYIDLSLTNKANVVFDDGAKRAIVDTDFYLDDVLSPSNGYWITNNAYANDKRSTLGGWWVVYFFEDKRAKFGFTDLQTTPTEQEILDIVLNYRPNDYNYRVPYSGNLPTLYSPASMGLNTNKANVVFDDGLKRAIVDTDLYLDDILSPSNGYWITNNTYANDKRSTLGGWLVVYFFEDKTAQVGLITQDNTPTEQQILDIVINSGNLRVSYSGHLPNSNDTYSTILINGNTMQTTDFAPNIESNFTIYCKYSCRNNSLPPFGKRYPNVITCSENYGYVGGNVIIKLFSYLNPGTLVPYSIAGVKIDDISNSPLNGSLTAPYQSLTYNIASGRGSTMVFSVKGSRQSVNIDIRNPPGFTKTIIGISGTLDGIGDYYNTTQINTYLATYNSTLSPLPGLDFTFVTGIAVDNSLNLYAAIGNIYNVIKVRDTSFNGFFSIYPFSANFPNNNSICLDDLHIYVASVRLDTSSIKKVSLSTGNLVGSFPMNPQCLCLNTKNTFLFTIDINNLFKTVNTSTGTIEIIGGTSGSAHETNNFADVSLNNALFHNRSSIAVDKYDNVYVCHVFGTIKYYPFFIIRKILSTNSMISSSSTVTTIYNTTSEVISSIAIDSNDNLYYLDTSSKRIYKITNSVRTLFKSLPNSNWANQIYIKTNILYIADRYQIFSIQL